ncbi:MAG: glycosyl hydrolase family 28-related protein [Oceanipulchritudo sp.]
MKKASPPFFLLLLLPAMAAHAWRSTLYPVGWVPPGDTVVFNQDLFVQDFSHAGFGYGEIPLPWPEGPVFNVLDYGADAGGLVDSTLAIQSAIEACGASGGGVVYLPEGLYRVAPPAGAMECLSIGSGGIILRGAGMGETRILNTSTSMRNKAILRVGNGAGSWLNSTSAKIPVTADLLGPVTRIPVADARSFFVGEPVVIHAEATPEWITEHMMDTTDYWLGQGSALGGVAFYRQIVDIEYDTSTLVIDTPLRYAIKTRDNAAVYRTHPQLAMVGIEHLSIGNVEHPGTTGWAENDYSNPSMSAYDVHNSWLIVFENVRHGWIRGVHSFMADGNTLGTHILSNGILVLHSRNITLRDCDLQKVQYGGGGGNGYTYRFQNAQEVLMVDSAARYQRHGIVQSHMRNSGNVFHRVLTQETKRQTAGTGVTSGSGSDHHMHFSQSMLFDMAEADRDFYDARWRAQWGTVAHGLTSTNSVYWNTRGERAPPNHSNVVRSDQYGYGFVIGTSGTTTSVDIGVSTFRTSPADYVEGAGTGDTLEPASLYRDQFFRRTGRELADVSLTIPAGLRQLYLGTGAYALLCADVDWGVDDLSGSFVRWSRTGGPVAVFQDKSAIHTLVHLPEPGVYRFQLHADSGWFSGFMEIELELVDAEDPAYLQWAENEFGSFVVADPSMEATVWGRLANPDSDRLLNTFEFLHGTDPQRFSPESLQLDAGETGRFRVAHQAGFPEVQWSANLSQWESMPWESIRITEVTATDYAAAFTVPGPDPGTFLRIKVDAEP